MNRDHVKQLALANGFKLKQQPDGTEDLNPYVYEFADALVADYESNAARVAQETQEFNLVALLKPSFGTDGNQFFFLYGDCISTGIAGFGDTPADAARDFSKNWYTFKAGGAV